MCSVSHDQNCCCKMGKSFPVKLRERKLHGKCKIRNNEVH